FQAVPVKSPRNDNNDGRPDSGLRELWNNDGIDEYFMAKFAPPTVAGGKVYLPANTVPVCPHGAQEICEPRPSMEDGGNPNNWAKEPTEVHGHVYVYGLTCPLDMRPINRVCQCDGGQQWVDGSCTCPPNQVKVNGECRPQLCAPGECENQFKSC